ncbi:MAG: SNF2-related protein, partial [Nocardioidaceae bacterium]
MSDASYTDFLAQKKTHPTHDGPVVDPGEIHALLHDWQKDIVRWAVRVGRAAIFASTGLGKTFMQLEWARLSGGTTLIVAPLAVCHQTIREAAKLELTVTYAHDASEITGPGAWISNYERVEKFDPAVFDAVVLDESSILKASDGKTRTLLIRHFADVPRRLSCTATPAPNDVEELTSQAAFLGVASRVNMLATWFIHDDEGWRLKGHARA